MRNTIDALKRPAATGLALVAALAVAAGCGYRLRGTGSSLPPGIRTLSVPVFKNVTTRYELDVKLTQAVIDEFVTRGKVALAADPAGADAVLEGEITGFTANPIGFTAGGQADRYSITVTAKVTLKERGAGKAVFSNPAFVYQQEYSVPPGSSFEAVQNEAIDKIAQKFARSLVVSILEGF
jgi:outer membrane lipopolysaccharide assembly protein LptE/RlpB